MSQHVANKVQSEEASLASRLAAAPRLARPGESRAKVDDWLAANASTDAGDALIALVAATPTVGDLLRGLADGSPFLWELASAEPERLLSLLQADPDRRLGALLADAAARVPATEDEAAAMRLLRRMKAEAALLVAIADIGGVWPVTRVTQALSELADTAVRAAVCFLLRTTAARGKLILRDPERPEENCGYVVLAMGKMGAGELNYSSDIDLIVLFDPQSKAVEEGAEPTSLFVRLTKGLVKLLQERTGDGYVFRVDLRLRPDPASTHIAISTLSALSYYESVGQNWERAALIKARPVAGDLMLGKAFLADLTPFIWRKYLDFVAVADIHAMKRQMHAYKGHDEIAVEGHNVKLGRGGIREIEFFVQTQQLIAGGRHPELRGRETLMMLKVLSDGGWIGPDAEHDLDVAYRFLRTVEHRLQMVADEQTQTLPAEPSQLQRFACFLGFADRDAFAAVLLEHLRQVQRHYAKLFEGAPMQSRARHDLSFPPDADDREALDRLTEMGFRRPLEVSATVRRWLAGSYRSVRSELARSHVGALAAPLLEHLARTDNPDAGVAALDHFLAGLQGGARLFSLLRQNPDLVALIARVLGIAPRLADILAQHPQVIDTLIDPAFFGALPDEAKLVADIKRRLDQAPSYEDFLDTVRLFRQEYMFLIGARILSGTVSAEQAGEAFARLADVLIRTLHQAVEVKFASTHGRLRGQESVVLALGKLGSREMTSGSDLDLILIYDFDEEHPDSDGERPLYGGQYFARFTHRLISALTAPTNYGALYDVDMRLRPSGRSGPVATKIESFAGYQETEAWTWEHMALTRARVVSGPPAFAARLEAVIRDVLCRPRDRETVTADVVEMRQAIAQEKGEDRRWDLKYAAGGLVDLEFIAQYLQLIHAASEPGILDTSTARVLDKACRLGLLSVADADVLRPAARLYHDLTQILRLCLSTPFDPKAVSGGLLDLLARAADVPDFATLEAHLAETQAQVRQSFNRILDAELPSPRG